MSNAANIPLFIATFIRHPLRIGSILPSSATLARHMTRAMNDQLNEFGQNPSDALIVELGAGTGVITSEIIASGINPHNLAINELDQTMNDYLRTAFTQSYIIQGDATTLSQRIPAHWLGKVSVVMSSLPVCNFSHEMKLRLVDDIFRMLRPGGIMVQFTYHLANPLSSERLAISGKPYKRVWGNIPPATIWLFRKRLGS